MSENSLLKKKIPIKRCKISAKLNFCRLEKASLFIQNGLVSG
jgi:hypothetical protein